jgi:holliday junction DNA helicase RuvB
MTDERSHTGRTPNQRKNFVEPGSNPGVNQDSNASAGPGRVPDRAEREANRSVAGEVQPGDKQVDHALRPRSLQEMIGQERLRDKMQILVDAARQRGDALDHVLLYGPPGLGKCITGDSLVLTNHGLSPLDEFIPLSLEPGSYTKTDAVVYGTSGLEAASHVYASGAGLTLHVRTRSGFEIEGTPNHPLLIATEFGPQWKRLDELTTDDYVAIAHGAEIWGKPQTAVLERATSAMRRQRSETIVAQTYTALSAKLGRSPTTTELRWTYAGGKSENVVAQYTAKRLGLQLADGRSVTQFPEPWTLTDVDPHPQACEIELDADLAYLMGVVVGDGNIERGRGGPAFVITASDPDMQREIQRISQKLFGFCPRVQQYGSKAPKLRFSQRIGTLLLAFGVQPVTAADKVVPSAVLTGSRDIAIGFLQGLFDSDGCAWPGGYVEFGTRSRALASQVQLLLANLGIVAHRTKKQRTGSDFWNLFIGGGDAVRFFEVVGFRLPYKQARKDSLAKTARAWTRGELVPGSNQALHSLLIKTGPHPRAVHKTFDHVKRGDRTPTRQQVQHYLSLLPEEYTREPEYDVLQQLLNPLIYWDRVAAVEQGYAETFDFVVPGTHSFVANGFYNHNTTLSHILAHEMGANLKVTAGPAVEKAGDLAAILTNLRKGDILFIDEIHRLGRAVEEILYPAMEDFSLNIVVGSGPGARNIQLSLPKFTVVGATTRLALMTSPLRARFGVVERFDFYDQAAVQEIVMRAARLLNAPIDVEGAQAIARRARGTPRVSLRLLRRLRDYAQVRAQGRITAQVADEALSLLEIDELGLDDLDRRVLDALINKFGGGPTGLDTLAASISEEPDTIMDVVEPYLLQLGFLDRTPRGRVATRAAYGHMQVPYPERPEQSGLFG